MQGGGGAGWPPWKGNLSDIKILFKYLENFLISRLYEQFSRNRSEVAVRKISNFSNMNILYIALKYVMWRFRMCNYIII